MTFHIILENVKFKADSLMYQNNCHRVAILGIATFHFLMKSLCRNEPVFNYSMFSGFRHCITGLQMTKVA